MTLSLLAIRPEPGCAATLSAARALGLPIEGHPLFEIVPVAWDAPAADSFDALLIGSANAFRHGGERLAHYRSLPVYAVGEATAAEAERAGFSVAMAGPGVLQPLVDRLEPQQRLLRLAGEDRVPLTVPAGLSIETRAVYRAKALPLAEAVGARLGNGSIVLLHSAVAARHFAAECGRLKVPREGVRIAALGPRIAAAAGAGWQSVRCAEQPSDAALLALAGDMCHEIAP